MLQPGWELPTTGEHREPDTTTHPQAPGEGGQSHPQHQSRGQRLWQEARGHPSIPSLLWTSPSRVGRVDVGNHCCSRAAHGKLPHSSLRWDGVRVGFAEEGKSKGSWPFLDNMTWHPSMDLICKDKPDEAV